jgi:hypothetical protein
MTPTKTTQVSAEAVCLPAPAIRARASPVAQEGELGSAMAGVRNAVLGACIPQA